MADQKISELTAKTTLHDTDLVPIVDIEAAPDETKKITGANLKAQVLVGHNAVLSTTIHNNNNYCDLLCQTAVVDIPPWAGGMTRFFVPALTVVSDPASKSKNGDWIGAAGAFIQADADSAATKIEDDSVTFTADMLYHYIKTASDAAGTTNVGYYFIIGVAAHTLTIYKASGTNFAASYYYYLTYQGWEIPVTGLYLIIGSIEQYPFEAAKWMDARILKTAGTTITELAVYTTFPGVGGDVYAVVNTMAVLTAGNIISLGGAHNGTAGTPDLYAANNGLWLKIFLLKQTA